MKKIHLIQAGGTAFPTIPGKEKKAVIFIIDSLEISSTSSSGYAEAEAAIQKADLILVSNEWDAYAYIELGIAIRLRKKVVVLNEPILINSAYLPKYKDFAYEVCAEESVLDYLKNLSLNG